MINAISVDWEEHFNVTGFKRWINPEDWATLPSRIDRNTDRVLALLSEHSVRATFFALGWLAERHPAILGRVAAAGHEIACHSYWHQLVYQLTPEQFREDTRRAKMAIEDATGASVLGYRAPAFSVVPSSEWALQILLELGFAYDSSVFPVSHDVYGWTGFGRFPRPILQRDRKTLWEFPLSTYPLLKRAVPVAGGGHLRLTPYHYTKWALEFINEEERKAACIYFHPWEIDPEQPHMPVGSLAQWRHRFGLSGMEAKLSRLLRDFEFAPISDVLGSLGAWQPEASAVCAGKETTQVLFYEAPSEKRLQSNSGRTVGS